MSEKNNFTATQNAVNNICAVTKYITVQLLDTKRQIINECFYKTCFLVMKMMMVMMGRRVDVIASLTPVTFA